MRVNAASRTRQKFDALSERIQLEAVRELRLPSTKPSRDALFLRRPHVLAMPDTVIVQRLLMQSQNVVQQDDDDRRGAKYVDPKGPKLVLWRHFLFGCAQRTPAAARKGDSQVVRRREEVQLRRNGGGYLWDNPREVGGLRRYRRDPPERSRKQLAMSSNCGSQGRSVIWLLTPSLQDTCWPCVSRRPRLWCRPSAAPSPALAPTPL